MTTPNGVIICAIPKEGSFTDITEGVQVLYDLVLQSMDFSSGFLTMEDVVPLLRLARACGFHRVEEIEDYMVERKAGEWEMGKEIPYKPKHQRVPGWNSPEDKENRRDWMEVVDRRQRRARQLLKKEGLL